MWTYTVALLEGSNKTTNNLGPIASERYERVSEGGEVDGSMYFIS